jgi:TRAP-type C4-dicarboxylate transport system permease small subunit
MKPFYSILNRLSYAMNAVAAVALTVMMLLTVADVTLRSMDSPIFGTYEIVSVLLALVIGFSMPETSLRRSHVYMEFLIENLPGKWQTAMMTFTRLLCIFLFILIGLNLWAVGSEYRLSGEVSPTLELPFYPAAYGAAICCFILCFVFTAEIIKLWMPEHE